MDADAPVGAVSRLPKDATSRGGCTGATHHQPSRSRTTWNGGGSHWNRPGILLVGAGGHARACVDVLEEEGRLAIAGLLGLSHEVGTRILAPKWWVRNEPSSRPGATNNEPMTARSGRPNQDAERTHKIFQGLENTGCGLPTIVPPFACVAACNHWGRLDRNAGAVVNAGATVGRIAL